MWKNGGLKFDGEDDWVSIGEMDYSSVTLDVIFECDKLDENMSILANYENGGYGISFKDNKSVGEVYVDNSYRSIYGNISINKKYKITYSSNGSELKLYINGKLVEQQNIVDGKIEMPTLKTIMVLGANPSYKNVTDQYFSGTIYQVKVYDRVLTAEQIAQNYEIDKVKYEIEKNEDKIEENIIFSNPKYANDSLTVEVKTNVEGYTLQTSTDGINWMPTINDNQKIRNVGSLSNLDTIYARLWDGEEYTNVTKYKLDYYIKDKEELEEFRNEVNSGNTFEGIYINLMNDIDLSSVETWIPIGNYSEDNSLVFKGIFNGNQHKISNLKVNNSLSYQGLFGYNQGNIENLTIESGNIQGENKVGAIVGENSGSIMNCTNKSILKATGYHVGGVCGHSDGIIQKCDNQGKCETNSTSLGGIVGRSDTIIKFCNNSGNIIGYSYAVGGITGTSFGGKIIGCKNTNDIKAEGVSITNNSAVGGILGNGNGDSNVIINCCCNTGNIEGAKSLVSGIVGSVNGKISYCYNTGAVTANGENSSKNTWAGGIVGFINEADNECSYCYNTGVVKTTAGTNKRPGGIAGGKHSSATVKYCYKLSTAAPTTTSTSVSDIEKTIIGNSGTVTSSTNGQRTAANMKTSSFVTLIGGTNYWKLPSNSYPKFIWE